MLQTLRPARSPLGALLALALAACSSLRVEVDCDPAFDFERPRTFAWARGIPAPAPATQRRIEESVEHELTSRGLALSEDGEPELWISTLAGGHSEVTPVNETGHLGENERRTRDRMGVTTDASPHLEEITVGTLTIEILDARTGGVVWRARADDTITSDPTLTGQKVADAIATAFREFPRSASAASATSAASAAASPDAPPVAPSGVPEG